MHKMIRKVESLTQKKQKKNAKPQIQTTIFGIHKQNKRTYPKLWNKYFPLFTSSEVSVLSLLNDRNFIYNLDPYN